MDGRSHGIVTLWRARLGRPLRRDEVVVHGEAEASERERVADDYLLLGEL